ncbi:Utp14-domain-containing protein [Thozetella sp. PMI_491]|nr:Utp14-domain-containing protein [Thozetella sp. PMI_491]
MPGRQAHGRPLLPRPSERKSKPNKKSRAQATSKALNAFALAEEQVPVNRKGVRTRYLEPELEDRSQKRQRQRGDEDEDDDFDDGDEDEPQRPQKKRARKEAVDDDDDEHLAGSDSEGNEWHVGVNGEDEDSDIDSDEAFGESDEEKFEGFAFSGSTSKPKTGGAGDKDDESDMDDDESLGSDAIDLATALDQFSDSESAEEQGSGSDEDEESSAESVDSDDEEEDEDDDDLTKLDTLQGLIAGFGGDDEDEQDDRPKTQPAAKISLADLGLTNIKDPTMKKSLKLMKKEEKEERPGAAKKLNIPLPRRHQDKLLRAAAYEKASETLDRWQDTVQRNRRAEHLVFPLPQNAEDRGLDHGELAPLHQRAAVGTELEQTILAIMEESGLGPSKPKPETTIDEDGQERRLTKAELAELQRQRRKEREQFSREQARAKRIKKIKSKAYRRIHRKEVLREEDANRQALLEAGEIDSEEERETHDRRRALERMGVRHRESKWAKLGKKAGRAVWDDDFRASLTDTALKEQELRRRIEGRRDGSDDEDDEEDNGSGSGDDTERRSLLRQLERAEQYDDEPESKLMQMGFMKRGEEERKRQNDELVRQLKRELDSGAEEEGSDEEVEDIGRRKFGNPQAALASRQARRAGHTGDGEKDIPTSKNSRPQPQNSFSLPAIEPKVATATGPGAPGAWSRSAPEEGRKSKKASGNKAEGLDLSNAALIAAKPPKSRQKEIGKTETAGDSSDDDGAIHLPVTIRDQDLIKRAFAGEDVVGDFEREKRGIEEDDDEKEIDNTLPGWGSWVGDGVSKREQKKHKGRFITKVEGVKKEKRKDRNLDKVIINERRVKKNDKYLSSQLPFPFESHQQYERSLRLPVGQEWMTKQTFQESTKPRVIVKQGIIAPMSKPMI